MPPFEEVLDAARAGEDGALEAIYRDLAPAVAGYLRGQRAGEPEDLTSDVFVGIVQGLRVLRRRAGVPELVFSIAHRRLLDERRRLARRRERPVDPGELAAEGPRERRGRGPGEARGRLGRASSSTP